MENKGVLHFCCREMQKKMICRKIYLSCCWQINATQGGSDEKKHRGVWKSTGNNMHIQKRKNKEKSRMWKGKGRAGAGGRGAGARSGAQLRGKADL